jgi:hypothetical protein
LREQFEEKGLVRVMAADSRDDSPLVRFDNGLLGSATQQGFMNACYDAGVSLIVRKFEEQGVKLSEREK